ncbi:Glycoside hydrolase family 16 [Macrophomina phaseolina MS6]|uniref:Glycoside hydrolase family 16 n=1 Tax=Macrophomina phaseolina (strain MS6) TaxID=1126212 RepID=K2RWJ0_MACPH|nr:Glycoside hydrolase family 16 [Macrophomina phaseolina MS6]
MLGKILPAVALGGGVALLWPELAWRAGTLQLITANVDTLQNVTVFKEQQIKHADILKNCEDVIILEEQGVALLSCDPQRDAWNTVMGTFIDPSPPGAVFQWFYTDPDSFPQPLAIENFGARAVSDFHPLGIEYHAPSSTLYVVNHASSGPTVELFDYVPWNGFGRAVATHRVSVKHDALWTPNSVHALNGTSFLATNDHFFRIRDAFVAQKVETYAALPGGSVVHVSIPETLPAADAETGAVSLSPSEIRVRTVADRIPFANGLALLNSSTLAVASTGARSVKLYDFHVSDDDGAVALAYRTEVRAPAMLDNVFVDAQGRLLAAGHPRPGALAAMVARRAECVRLRLRAEAAAVEQHGEEEGVDQRLGEDASEQEELADAQKPRTVKVALSEEDRAALERCLETYDETSPSWVGELVVGEDGGLAWRELLVGHQGYGASSGVARDAKEGIVLVSGLYEKGIFIGKE